MQYMNNIDDYRQKDPISKDVLSPSLFDMGSSFDFKPFYGPDNWPLQSNTEYLGKISQSPVLNQYDHNCTLETDKETRTLNLFQLSQPTHSSFFPTNSSEDILFKQSTDNEPWLSLDYLNTAFEE